MIQNKDIINCLPLLASVLGDRYGVEVRIGGHDACTNGKVIRIPALPVDCDKTALALAKGYIDHESASVIQTSPSSGRRAWTRRRAISSTPSKTGVSSDESRPSSRAAGKT